MDLRELNTERLDFQRHPWEIIRLEFVVAALEKIFKNKTAPLNILDIGCGDLYVSKGISSYFSDGKIVSVDTAYNSCFDLPKIHVVNSLEKIPKRIYSLVLLLDVLEHIEDDRGFLENLIKQYASLDTFFLITVPLHPFLFSEHDVNLGHKRRYTYSELMLQLQSAGLKIIDSGNMFSSLFIFRIMQLIFGKVYTKLRPGYRGSSFADVASWNHSDTLTNLTNWLLRVDIKYTNKLPGLSGYALAMPRR